MGFVNVMRDPAPLDYFDLDVMVPAIAKNNAVPLKWMHDEDTVAKIRQGRMKQQQQQQVVQAMPGVSAMLSSSAKVQGAVNGPSK